MPWKIFPEAIKQQNATGALKSQGTDSLDRDVIQPNQTWATEEARPSAQLEAASSVSLNPNTAMISLWFSDGCFVDFVTKYQLQAGSVAGGGGVGKNESSNLWWHVAVHLLRFLHLLRRVTLRGWVFIFLLQSRGGPALGRACVHGGEVPRRAGAVGSIIQISFKVNAHSWGGHIAFDNIPLILWSITRNKV